MPLAAPVIDDRMYETLLGEILRRVPVDAPDWTDSNESDSGVTLVQLLAFLTESLLWRLDERQRQRRRRRLGLLVAGAAGTFLFLWAWQQRRDP